MASVNNASSYWAIHTAESEEENLGDEFRQLKKDLIQEYGEENIRKSWLEVTAALAQEAETIRSKGSLIIPVIEFDKLNELAKEDIDEIKHRGVLVIRNVLPQEQARSLQADLEEYLQGNDGAIKAFPTENPWFFASYFSPVQHQVRTHPHSLKLQKFLNSLWTGYSADEALPEPLIYADGLRHRRPGGFAATVQPHIDAGSLDRWADEGYRRFYEGVFSGQPSRLDPFNIKTRIAANQAKFPGWQQSTVLRTFQGWTALSASGEEFGRSSLAVYPNLKLAQSYVLLRPFFKPPADGSLDPTKWVLDESDSFPGSGKGLSQKVRDGTHPHLQLATTLTLTPRINPGDAVFWHSDIIHAVDPIHNSNEAATVLYIPAVPLTRNNVLYVKGQRDALLANGQTPPDFSAKGGNEEAGLQGWRSASAISNPEGRRAYGLEGLAGSEEIVQWANEVLGTV